MSASRMRSATETLLELQWNPPPPQWNPPQPKHNLPQPHNLLQQKLLKQLLRLPEMVEITWLAGMKSTDTDMDMGMVKSLFSSQRVKNQFLLQASVAGKNQS